MNSIITLPQIAALLSRATSTDPQEAEKFVIHFTNLVAEALLSDSSVKIKGFGSFTRVESFGKTVVKFEPEKEISDRINAPFSCFEPETLADGVSASVLAEADKKVPSPQPRPQVQPTQQTQPRPQTQPAPQAQPRPQAELTPAPQPWSQPTPQPQTQPAPARIPTQQPWSQPVPQTEPQPAPQTEPQPAPQPWTQPSPQPQTPPQPAPQPWSQPAPQPGYDPYPPTPPRTEEEEPFEEEVTIEEKEVWPEYPAAEERKGPAAGGRVIESNPRVDRPSPFTPLEEERTGTERTVRRPMPMDAHTEEENPPRRPVPPRLSYSHDYDEDRSSSKNSWFWLSVAFILGILIGFAVGYFCHDPIAARAYFGTKSRLGADDIVEAEMWYGPEDTISLVKEMVDFNNVDSLGMPNAEYVTDQPTTPADPLAPAEPTAKPTEKETPQTQAAQTPATQTPVQQTPAQQTPQQQPSTQPTPTPQPKQNAETTPVYDMIPAGGTLQTLAAKHYGNKVYWVYIYEENKANISNPNYVSQNLKLRIPPRSKYDVSSVEAENQAAAKKKAFEVLSKFR